MYTCKVCGKTFSNINALGGHSTGHKHRDIDMTYTQRQILLGGLLGDMSIRIIRGAANPRVSAVQSVKQTDYLMWKYSVLKNLISNEPYITSGLDGFGGIKIHDALRFDTMALPCLLPIHNLVRGVGNKYISTFWLNEITDPIALAVWYMDDGSLTNKLRQMSFALGTISDEECFNIQNWMLYKWDITSHIYSNLQKERVNIRKTLTLTSRSNVIKFKELIEPYIIPSMVYKIR
jgi:hypothetical protein